MRRLFHILIILLPFALWAQEETESKKDSINTDFSSEIVAVNSESTIAGIEYLTEKNPMRAALYSAAVPGWGQWYNGKWWKVPLVWGVIGTGTGFVVYYNNLHKEYRGYYLDKLYGVPIENPGINKLSKEQLATIQDNHKRSRDYAIALTALGYILNILDATVDAHLFGIKNDPDLSMKPVIIQNQHTFELAMGFGVKYSF